MAQSEYLIDGKELKIELKKPEFSKMQTIQSSRVSYLYSKLNFAAKILIFH